MKDKQYLLSAYCARHCALWNIFILSLLLGGWDY